MATRTPGPARRRADTSPPHTGPGEKETLVGILDYLRDCVQDKVEGVPEPDVRTPGVESGTNLLGLVRHLTFVERFVFLGEDTRWPATFRARKSDTVESVLAGYRDAIARSNDVVAACTDLASPAARPADRGGAVTMRWALVHMVEETGRHAGHMDILREQLDGRTGR